jgi:hypothetical protein
MDRKTAHQRNDQEGHDRDRQHQQEIGDASLQPMHLDFPRAEKDLVEVKDPERQRNAEQNSADGCERDARPSTIHAGLRLENLSAGQILVKPPRAAFFPQAIDYTHKIILQSMS